MRKRINRLISLILVLSIVFGGSVYAESTQTEDEEIIIVDFNPPAEETAPSDMETDENLQPEEPSDGEAAEEPGETDAQPKEDINDSADAEEPETGEEIKNGSEEENEEKPRPRIRITSSLEGVESVQPGTPITLTAHLEGFDEISYRLQWQYSLDGENWKDEKGANGTSFSFVLDESNDAYIWRVIAIINKI